jgi:hypothetical protein
MRYNPTNFKVDRAGRTILLIDNVQMSEEFAFKSFQNSVATLTSDKAYRTWSQRHDTRWLRAGDLKAIAGYMVQSLKSGIENWEQVRPEDLATVQRALDNSRGWWVQGLEQGREWLRAAAQSLDQLTQGIAPEDVREVQESLMKRLNHLFPELFPELRRRALAED